jgi:hypothetical protein
MQSEPICKGTKFIITCSLNQFVKELSQEDSKDFILQQNGAPPHFHRQVRRFLNEHLSRCLIGLSVQNNDLPLEDWTPRSPDITPRDFSCGDTSRTSCSYHVFQANLRK